MQSIQGESEEKMRVWRLYAKFKNQNQFRPLDWKTGKQVINLIYASLFNDDEKNTIEKIDIPLNSDVQFKWEKIPLAQGL